MYNVKDGIDTPYCFMAEGEWMGVVKNRSELSLKCPAKNIRILAIASNGYFHAYIDLYSLG